ncbi:MAG: hypothetical protein KTR30_25290 [Saprospiraceae bacterium]|nr:hypothetical protein [Saprospiraceae bacterium]
MFNSKLIQILQTFDSKQRRAFEDFVSSPYFNKQFELIQYYKYLKKLAVKGFPAHKLAREELFRKVWPNQDYNEKQLNYLSSQLLKLVERFTSIAGFEAAGILPDYFQLQYYIDHRLEKHYQYGMKGARKKLEQDKRGNEQYFYQQYLLADLREKHFSSLKERRYDTGLQEAADYLDQYYLFKKLYHLCAMLDRQHVVTPSYDTHFIEDIQHMVRKLPFDSPAIQTLEQLLLSLRNPSESSHFRQVRDLLRQHGALFSDSMLRTLYFSVINFCIRKVRYGEKSYANELMSIYQEGIQKGVLIEDGYLSPWTFKNLVKLGIGLKEYQWTESIIAEYAPKLPPHMQQDALHFNLADLYYALQDYPKAQIHLRQVEFSDVQYSFGAKLTLTKIYFETDQEEALHSLISSFKIFLQRKKLITKDVKMPYLNFIHFVHKLYKAKPSELELLKDKIQTTEMLTARSWLLRQLAERQQHHST